MPLDQERVELRDHALQLLLGRRRVDGDLGRPGQRLGLGPFVGDDHHRLREVERPELGIDRHRHDRAGERHVVGVEPRPLRPEQDRRPFRRAPHRRRRLLGRHHGLGHSALAHGGGIDVRAVRHRVGDAAEYPRLRQHDVRPARRRPRVRVGPAVARGDEPKLAQPEIEHRARGLADILAQLRADQDDRGLRSDYRNVAHPRPTSSTVPANASKSRASLKSRYTLANRI